MKSTQQDYFGPFLSCAWANDTVAAEMWSNFFQAVTQTQIQAKTNFPQVVTTAAQSVAMCTSLHLRESTTAWQRVQLCGRINRASVPHARSLFTLPQTIKGSSATAADKKEVKLLKH